jgi:hypothetical protein
MVWLVLCTALAACGGGSSSPATPTPTAQQLAEAQSAKLTATLNTANHQATLAWSDTFPAGTSYSIEQQGGDGSWSSLDAVPGTTGTGAALTWTRTINSAATLRVAVPETGYSLASTANPSPRTNPSAMHRCTTPSNTHSREWRFPVRLLTTDLTTSNTPSPHLEWAALRNTVKASASTATFASSFVSMCRPRHVSRNLHPFVLHESAPATDRHRIFPLLKCDTAMGCVKKRLIGPARTKLRVTSDCCFNAIQTGGL